MEHLWGSISTSTLKMLLITLSLICLSTTLFYEKNFYTWVLNYWFYKRSFANRVASCLYCLGIIFLTAAGIGAINENNIDTHRSNNQIEGVQIYSNKSINDEYLVIAIDISASMLVEDTEGNKSRIKTALSLAKNLIIQTKKQNKDVQIGLVVFNHQAYYLSPFTNDTEYLLNKLQSLEKITIDNNGTNIKLAIFKAFDYFSSMAKSVNNLPKGWVIILSDGDENLSVGNVNQENTNFNYLLNKLIFVSIGSLEGGKIPLRDSTGELISYKKTKNGGQIVEVWSKINKDFIQSMLQSIPVSNYWMVKNNQNVNEIVNYIAGDVGNNGDKKNEGSFLTSTAEKNISSRIKVLWDTVIKACTSWVDDLLIFGVLFIGVASLLLQLKTFRHHRSILFILLINIMDTIIFNSGSLANINPKEELVVLNANQCGQDQFKKKIISLIKGNLKYDERSSLADCLLISNQLEKAIILYEEILGKDWRKDGLNFSRTNLIINYGTALLKKNKFRDGVQVYQTVAANLNEFQYSKYKKIITNNLLTALAQKSSFKEERLSSVNSNKKGPSLNQMDDKLLPSEILFHYNARSPQEKEIFNNDQLNNVGSLATPRVLEEEKILKDW